MPSPGLKITLIKATLWVVCYIAFIVQISIAQAQSGRDQVSDSTAWEDHINELKPRNRPLYMGLDISMGAPLSWVKSDIEVLNHLPVSYFGGMAGGVLATPAGKIKGGVGLYYSEGNQPYSFDLVTGSLTYSLYLLRIKEVKYHMLEPYVFAGISQMRNKLYGYYLDDQSAKKNYSYSEAPYLGTINSSLLTAGTGVEYQLESDTGSFIHWYAEIGYGTVLLSGRNNNAFNKTSISNTLFVSVGVSFGKFK